MFQAIAVFFSLFLSEIGCKTQLVSILMVTNKQQSPLVVFIITSLALLLANGIAVIVGIYLGKHFHPHYLKLVGAIGFMLIGVLTFVDYLKHYHH